MTTAEGQSALAWSEDGGVTWTEVLAGREVVDLAFDPAHPGTLFAALAGPRRQVLESVDGGATWLRGWGTGLPRRVSLTALVFDATAPATLLAATATGEVFASADGGATWEADGAGLPPLPILTLSADGMGSVYAGVLGGGVYLLRRGP
jgi:photosystem II stability/assembly factor-like uncharacterized protein